MALVLLAPGLPFRRQCCTASLQRPRDTACRAQRTRIFWDLDNINARSPEHALVVGHRLKRAAHRLTGVTPELSAFANKRTVELLRERGDSAESWDAVLDVLQAKLMVAGLEKDAADLLMQRDMVMFAEEHGRSGAVICVSNDQGFAPALEKCGRWGAFTVAVGTYMRAAGFNWSTRPSQLPVPAAANCIVAWHPGRAAHNSSAERKLLAHWQSRVDAGHLWLDGGSSSSSRGTEFVTALHPLVSTGSARARAGASALQQQHVKAHKGVCCTRWLNPNRPRLPPALAAKSAAAGASSAAGAADGC